jgi:hypothetical protein
MKSADDLEKQLVNLASAPYLRVIRTAGHIHSALSFETIKIRAVKQIEIVQKTNEQNQSSIKQIKYEIVQKT